MQELKSAASVTAREALNYRQDCRNSFKSDPLPATKLLLSALTLLRVALVFKYYLLFKTVLDHDA